MHYACIWFFVLGYGELWVVFDTLHTPHTNVLTESFRWIDTSFNLFRSGLYATMKSFLGFCKCFTGE